MFSLQSTKDSAFLEDKETTNRAISPQIHVIPVKGSGFDMFRGLRNKQTFIIWVNHTTF